MIDRYIASVSESPSGHQTSSRAGDLQGIHRHGDLASEILCAELVNSAGVPVKTAATGNSITIRVKCRFNRRQNSPTVGILVRNRIGIDIYGTNTRIEGLDLGTFDKSDLLEINFRFDCWLTPQEYTVTVATQNDDGSSNDWWDDAILFDVVGNRHGAGIVDLRADVSWKRSGEAYGRTESVT